MSGAGVVHAQVQAFALGNRAEEHGGSGPVGVQFLPVAKDAFACPQNQADDVVLDAPGARRAVQAGGRGIEPVQVGDGEEAVGVGAVAFVRGMPVRPGGVEFVVGNVPAGPGCRRPGSGRRFQWV